MSLPSQWASIPFETCLSDDSPRVGKIQQKDYLESGQFPIIDQSQLFISGYTNRSDLVYKGNLPVILFGDHTLAFKYVDFPFVCGADGVKVLVPNTRIVNPEYFYFFLRNLDLQSRGYSRHYKQLRKAKVTVPPIPEQQRIADILHQSNALRKMRLDVNTRTEHLLPSLFEQMFGTADKWKKITTLRTLVKFVGGGTPSRSIKRYFSGNIPWATSKDIKSRYLYDAQEHITEEAIENSATNIVPAGSILVVVKSKILMHTLPIGITTVPFCFGQDIKGLICNPKVVPQFIVAAMLSQSNYILRQARGANTEGLTLDMLRAIPVPDVSIEMQEEFQRRILAYDEIETYSQLAKDRHEDLHRSLLIRSFSGELTARWREKHKDELQNSAVERDKVLGLRGEKPRLIDFEEGRVTPEEMEVLRNALGNFAVNLASYHIDVDGLARSLEEITKPLTQSLVSMSQNLITPFLESFRQSLQNIQLSLPVPPDEEEINRQIDLLPLPQEKRAIHDVLDATSLRVLKLAHASPAYFTPEDLTFGGITSTHTSASLRVLDSLGFVRLVEIDGVLRYHVIDANTDTALKPDQLQQ